jgi:hypothetical protein
MRLIYVLIFALLFIKANGQELQDQTPPLNAWILTADDLPTHALSSLLSLLQIHDHPLAEIVSETQKSWLQIGKERWELTPKEEEKRDLLWPLFKQIGLIDPLYATQQHYDYALVYGGFYSRVVSRYQHLIATFQQGARFEEIVLLTGQRFLDSTYEKDLPFSTETEMMIGIWKQMDMPEEMRNIPLTVIDSPQQIDQNGRLVRPNTKSTIVDWLKTRPREGTCLFVSCQPFCGYQDSVARTYLPSGFLIETIGPQSERPLPISIYLDNLARWLYQEKIRRG